MELSKNANNINLSNIEEFNSKVDLLYAAIDTYSGLTLDRSVWLSEREKDYFISIVIFNKLGAKKYSDSQAIEVISEVFGEHVRQERSIYAKKLQDKNWIKIDEETKHITIPPFFQFIDLDKGQIDFNMSLRLNSEKELEEV